MEPQSDCVCDLGYEKPLLIPRIVFIKGRKLWLTHPQTTFKNSPKLPTS